MAELIRVQSGDDNKLVFTKRGQYVVFIHNISGTFTVELAAPDVEVDIFGLFVGSKEDQYTIKTIQHHTAPRSVSNLFIKGVFDDSSRFHYEGLIRIEKTGQQSHAYQKNQNILLSPSTYVESKPFLEILANDVFCTHGSSTGKLNEEQLFYLETRGLSRPEARRLMVEGFIAEVGDKIREKIPTFEL